METCIFLVLVNFILAKEISCQYVPVQNIQTVPPKLQNPNLIGRSNIQVTNTPFGPKNCELIVNKDLPLPINNLALLHDVLQITSGKPMTSTALTMTNNGISSAAYGLPVENKVLPVIYSGMPITMNGLPMANNGLPLTANGIPMANNDLPLSITEFKTPSNVLAMTNDDLLQTNELLMKNKGISINNNKIAQNPFLQNGITAHYHGPPNYYNVQNNNNGLVPVICNRSPIGDPSHTLPCCYKIMNNYNNGMFVQNPGIISLDNNGIPVAQNVIPLSNNAIPFANIRVPLANNELTITNNNIPLKHTGVPLKNSKIPLIRNGIHLANTGISLENNGIPLAPNEITRENNEIPLWNIGKLLTNHGISFADIRVPSANNEIPTNNAIRFENTGVPLAHREIVPLIRNHINLANNRMSLSQNELPLENNAIPMRNIGKQTPFNNNELQKINTVNSQINNGIITNNIEYECSSNKVACIDGIQSNNLQIRNNQLGYCLANNDQQLALPLNDKVISNFPKTGNEFPRTGMTAATNTLAPSSGFNVASKDLTSSTSGGLPNNLASYNSQDVNNNNNNRTPVPVVPLESIVKLPKLDGMPVIKVTETVYKLSPVLDSTYYAP